MKQLRIWCGGIIEETNTFSPLKCAMEDFRRFHFALGDEVLRIGFEHELKGFLETTEADPSVEVLCGLSANAVSSGTMDASAWQDLLRIFRESSRSASGADGAYLALHGAMAADGCEDACGALIEALRESLGPDKPLVISLDLHANVTRKMVERAQGIVGYRTFPHTDHRETGQRSARLLLSLVQGGAPYPSIALRKIPMIVPAENSQSSSGPFAELWAEAEKGERAGDSIVTSLFPVQPWLDLADMGCSVVVVGRDAEAASAEAERLAELFWAKRHAFAVELRTVREIVALASEGEGGGKPFVLSDSADSPGAGSAGDSNYVLKELLAANAQDRLDCLLTMVDGPAVARAIEAGVGRSVELEVGYTLTKGGVYGAPIRITGTVRRIGDGKFRFSGGSVKGATGNMGRCVVLQIGRISLLLCEYPTFTGDPALYRSMGLEPLEADLVLVKSANQFRADYEPLTPNIYILDTPGASTADVRRLAYRNLPRPFYPFDDNFEWRNLS